MVSPIRGERDRRPRGRRLVVEGAQSGGVTRPSCDATQFGREPRVDDTSWTTPSLDATQLEATQLEDTQFDETQLDETQFDCVQLALTET